MIGWLFVFSAVCSASACNRELIGYEKDDLKVSVEAGGGYLHDFPLFMGIRLKNPPQMAVWIESVDGEYLLTVYVTDKIARQGWMASGGSRRKEALPCWCHARGVVYGDGLMLPTKKEPLTDGISGATPQGDYELKMSSRERLRQFVVKIEVNHSTDFNAFYPESAQEGEAGYSGGKKGSGQPALVYADTVDLDSGKKQFEAVLIGHSSPDGSNGGVEADVSQLTTALDIIKRIVIRIEE